MKDSVMSCCIIVTLSPSIKLLTDTAVKEIGPTLNLAAITQCPHKHTAAKKNVSAHMRRTDTTVIYLFPLRRNYYG